MEIIQRVLAAPTDFSVTLGTAQRDLGATVGKLFNIIGLIAGILVFGYLVYSGFIYITAGGNAEQAKKGIGGITNAIIGLLIIVLAYSLFYGIRSAVNTAK